MLTAALCCALSVWLSFPDGPDSLDAPFARFALQRPVLRTRLKHVSVAPALSALAAELAAGKDLVSAFLATPEAEVAWPTAAAALRLDADVPAALHEDKAHSLAACWQLAGSSGVGLAPAILSLAAFERDASQVREHLAAELAGPRASARMLAALPLVGIVMGVAMGADPAGFLLGSAPGLLCLGAGLALTGLGLAWGAAIARRVERLL